MANRIKELRRKQGLTLDGLAAKSGIKRGTLNNYELGKTEPKLETWKKLADFFKVPVDYLQGYSDDPVGWHLWEDATGYSRSTIEFQIQELIKAGKLSANTDIQAQIGEACVYLDGRGKTDHEAVMYARQGLSELDNKIHAEFYIDPAKKKKYGKKLGDINLSTPKDYDGSLYFDDMNKEVYDKISTILNEARDKLADYLQNHNF